MVHKMKKNDLFNFIINNPEKGCQDRTIISSSTGIIRFVRVYV